MTASFRVVAPGKLMVAGEYSVLGPDGYALAFAVSPGLTAACRPAGRWRLERADIPEPWEEGQPVPGTFRYVHAALDRTAPPHSVVIARAATGAIGAGARKPGVGGSASAAVLGAAISLAARGEPLRRDTVLAGALTAHAAGQGGRGSGYDVATIVHGGLVLWRPARLAGGVSTPAGEARRLEWPKGLHVIAGYTGQSASTTRLLGALEARAQADSVGTLRRLARLGEPVRDLAEAFEDRDVQRVLVALARCHEALLSWDAAERLGVMTILTVLHALSLAMPPEPWPRYRVPGVGTRSSRSRTAPRSWLPWPRNGALRATCPCPSPSTSRVCVPMQLSLDSLRGALYKSRHEWANSSVGRASVLHAEGRRFEPCFAHRA